MNLDDLPRILRETTYTSVSNPKRATFKLRGPPPPPQRQQLPTVPPPSSATPPEPYYLTPQPNLSLQAPSPEPTIIPVPSSAESIEAPSGNNEINDRKAREVDDAVERSWNSESFTNIQ